VTLALAAALAGALSPVAANPSARLQPPEARLGDLVHVRVDVEEPVDGPGRIEAFFCHHPLVRTAEGLQGWIAVPTDTSTGTHPLTVVLGAGRALRVELRVRGREFHETRLRVAPEFTGERSPALEARRAREQKRFDAVWSSAAQSPRVGGDLVTRARRPIRGRRTGRFGTRRTFNGVLKSAHYGLDLAAPPGRAVSAAWPGEVVLTGHMWGSGRTVVLDHGAGLFSLYFHLRRIRAAEGDAVRAGETIGEVGSSGRATGPHLHFAVAVQCRDLRSAGEGTFRSMYVDPEPLLP